MTSHFWGAGFNMSTCLKIGCHTSRGPEVFFFFHLLISFQKTIESEVIEKVIDTYIA